MNNTRQDLIRGIIITLRKKQGLRQSDLAEKSGLQASMVSKIETGRRNVSLEDLEKLSVALNVPIEVFFISEQADEAIYYKGYTVLTKLKHTNNLAIDYIVKQTKENLAFLSSLEHDN